MAASASPRVDGPRLALIIDDLGYSLERGRRAIDLPGPLTVAVLPFTPHADQLASVARQHGRDVILHQPMESTGTVAPTPGVLTAEMPIEAFRRTLRLALDTLPQAIGVSNHTGSLLTTRREQMDWLMAEVQDRGLFFIDSRTTPGTVARDAALGSGVPTLQRDVFLDHVIEEEAIAESFERAIRIARRNGHAVLIAHPHDLSLEFLEATLPALAARGVSQVLLPELLTLRRRADAVPPRDPASLRTAHAP